MEYTQVRSPPPKPVDRFAIGGRPHIGNPLQNKKEKESRRGRWVNEKQQTKARQETNCWYFLIYPLHSKTPAEETGRDDRRKKKKKKRGDHLPHGERMVFPCSPLYLTEKTRRAGALITTLSCA
ncbi:hypothetical protein BHM03_00039375 [Ensete ventricosum]|nr:hypothetical protein BHM03_00039375 [Ensete ventricosum]